MSVNSDISGSDESYLDGDNNLKIQFVGNTAEALDKRKFGTAFDHKISDDWTTSEDLWWSMDGFEEEHTSKDSHQEEIEFYSNSFEKECLIKDAFEKKVAMKVEEIQQIVKWDEISKVSQFLFNNSTLRIMYCFSSHVTVLCKLKFLNSSLSVPHENPQRQKKWKQVQILTMKQCFSS